MPTDAASVAVARTGKLIQALAVGCWVVAPAWLEACQEAKAWVPEGPFEIRGDSLCLGGAFKARRRKERGQPGLFTGYTFRVLGKGRASITGMADICVCVGGSIGSD